MVDDQLRLIFTCCHPALAVEAQVALTLRTVCGLDHRRDCARFSVAGGYHGAAAGAGEAQDPGCASAVRNATQRPAG